MPDERAPPPKGHPADPSTQRKAAPESLRTLPLDDGLQVRDELTSALKEVRRPAVVVMSGNEVGTRKRVSGNATIGRDPTNELVLSDAGISWRHARIEDRGDAWALVDLGSTNGSVVNGEKRGETLLAHGDKIVLGRTVLRFELMDRLEQQYDDELQRLLHIDDLSGLYVRRRFDRELARLVEAGRASGSPVALLVMDMDGIKAINDRHGHLFGAYTIGETGRLIGRVVGERGIGSRFGGDEFCAALPGLDTAAGVAVAEEVRAAVAAYPYEREGVALKPGISIGVASAPADARDAESLFQRGDEALYRAKQGGKNRVCI
ncbi:MAG: GGDEF domain-containing protein [Polyangiales bacterium]